MGENMRGFAVEVPYASRPGSGYSGAIRKVIADNPSSNSWEFDFGTNGYTGCMVLEIQKELKFVAWTHTCFNDITFFPSPFRQSLGRKFPSTKKNFSYSESFFSHE